MNTDTQDNSHKQKIINLPLEPVKGRYTKQLREWQHDVFSIHFDYMELVPNEPEELVIQSGEVLDSVQRSKWAMRQIDSLLNQTAWNNIHVADFFHPGLEAVPYSRRHYDSLSTFCWAQTFDQFDFTRKMSAWMRAYEFMAMEVFTHVFVASELLQELMCVVVPEWEEKIHVVGLPFDSQAILRQAQQQVFEIEPVDVVFTSRLDVEKQPEFYLEIVRRMPHLTFGICTASEALRGNSAVIKFLENDCPTNLVVYKNLSKEEYYSVLRQSTVQFNCALQDWVSFTLLEALTFNCIPVYPNFRSFPAELENSIFSMFMYAPNNLQYAMDSINSALEFYGSGNDAEVESAASSILKYHDETLTRMSKCILEM